MADRRRSPRSERQDQPAWLKLYLARRARQPTLLPAAQPAGRPRRSVPMKQTSLWLTAGDRELVGRWQDYLTDLAGSSISLGEAVAILARICDDRLNVLGGEEQFEDLTTFILQMIDRPRGGENESTVSHR